MKKVCQAVQEDCLICAYGSTLLESALLESALLESVLLESVCRKRRKRQLSGELSLGRRNKCLEDKNEGEIGGYEVICPWTKKAST